MRWALSSAVLIGITAWAAWGQAPSQTQAARLEFDVASLKPVVLDGADTYMANLGTYRNGVLAQTNTTLAECLRFAYEITSDDLLSGPDWIKNKNVPRPRPPRRAARRSSCCAPCWKTASN